MGLKARIYKRILINTATIVEENDKLVVYPTNVNHYMNKKEYYSSAKIHVGMFGNLIRMFSKKGQFFVVPRAKLKDSNHYSNGVTLDSFDGLSLSSINRPLSKLFVSKQDKALIERWINPFALITDGIRATNTFLYQMPTVKLSNYRLEMFHKSKLSIYGAKFQYELFGVPGVTVFLDKDNDEVNNFIQELTNVPFSLEGDGLIVSNKFMNDIKVIGTDEFGSKSEIDLPVVVKMQGVARSKGITLARFNANRLMVEVNGQYFPVDVIMNTQGKRKNKVANIVASGMRMRKYLGEDIEAIDIANPDQQYSVAIKYGILTGKLIFDGKVIGVVPVGINKYYFDLTHNTAPRIANANVTYVQAMQLYKITDYQLQDRFVQKDIVHDLDMAREQLSILDNMLEKLNNIKSEMEGDNYGE